MVRGGEKVALTAGFADSVEGRDLHAGGKPLAFALAFVDVPVLPGNDRKPKGANPIRRKSCGEIVEKDFEKQKRTYDYSP